VAEAVVGLFLDEAEACFLVEANGWRENTLRPEDDALVACVVCEMKAFADECVAETEASG
jgi:hypothetical protein